MINLTQQILFASGALLAFLSVAAGAFGAHFLKQRLSTDQLTVFETAARYQMYHALAILIVCLCFQFFLSKWFLGAGWFFLTGTIIFSGSLYLIVFTGCKTWGIITPIGGVLFLIGWLCMFAAFVHSNG
jgi:uncharacterized membrane protein YgdD (TMEM256/DUF423 family)